MPTRAMLLALCASLLTAAPAEEIQWRIRRAAIEDSQILRTLHYLTDVYGPRVTGSPRLKAASDWAASQLTQWGLSNVRLEPWDFGHPGWENERLSVHALFPFKDALTVEALAWTSGTEGRVRGTALHVVIPERPTQAELDTFLESIRPNIKGRIVLVGAHTVLPITMSPPAKRREDAEVEAQYDPANPNPPGPPGNRPAETPPGGKLSARQVDARVNQFLAENGALARVNNAAREHGQIRAFHNRTFDPAKAPTTVVMRMEDYGRITRILADGAPVELELEIENRWYPAGKTAYNLIAELPGSEKKEEVVMLGAHLDSWHSATGATDNAIGCAMMMEAIRILKAIGANPRRTIRLALWSGEEQGLLGSKAYVAQHFGTAESPKSEATNFVAYVNIDSGTGRARGMSVFGPPSAATMLREIIKPLADLGIAGARETNRRVAGGTDSTSFNAAGFPGIGIAQDPIEYGTHTWHTNLDTYERIIPEDAQKAVTVIATAVYELANREERLPTFPKKEMPAAPKARATE